MKSALIVFLSADFESFQLTGKNLKKPLVVKSPAPVMENACIGSMMEQDSKL